MARLSVLVEFAKRSVTPAKTYLCDCKKKATCALLAASSQPISRKYLARLARWRDKNTVLVPSVDFYSVSNMIKIKEKIEIGVCLMSVFSFLQVYSV